MVRFSGSALTVGVERHVVDGVQIAVYSPAKTVADCFKFRRKIDLDVALEALRECWRARRADMDASDASPKSALSLTSYGLRRVTRVMAPRDVKNVAASVRQRLLSATRTSGEPFDLILTRYGIERLLYRLSAYVGNIRILSLSA